MTVKELIEALLEMLEHQAVPMNTPVAVTDTRVDISEIVYYPASDRVVLL